MQGETYATQRGGRDTQKIPNHPPSSATARRRRRGQSHDDLSVRGNSTHSEQMRR